MGNPVPTAAEAPHVHLKMRSGRILNLLDPSPVDVVPNDFVYGASRVPRWGGQTKGEIGFSVLQHMTLTTRIADRLVLVGSLWPQASSLRALALKIAHCHDLHEGGGLGDIITPYGVILNIATGALEELKFRLDRAIFMNVRIQRPSVEQRVKTAVKKADRIAAVSEAIQLLGYGADEARQKFGGAGLPIWTDPIVPLDEAAARGEWAALARQIGLAIEEGR
ncbi:MAG: hypothetical protein IBJ15_01005 [Alphaproteobacteria bacterium]|nr:hypothetical protein [Alphaproteobacteria bacterium]